MRYPVRGFSFIEVVVAFGLLAVMVSIFFNLIPSSTLATKRAENRLSASNIAQNHLEELRAAPFHTLDSHDGTVTVERRGNIDFTRKTTVSNLPAGNPQHLKLVKIQVAWTERTKEQKLSYELRVFNQNR
jgi:Tfp pilus assembly protein PilV